MKTDSLGALGTAFFGQNRIGQSGFGLMLDIGEFGEALLKRGTLIMQLGDALAHRGQQLPDLGEMGWIDVVQIEIFFDFSQRKTKPLAA